MINRRSILVAAVVAPVAGLEGCATLTNILGSGATATLIQAGIALGVGVLLAKNPAEAPAVAAAATLAATLVSGSGTTLATLEANADAAINSATGINPPEKLALETIVTLAAAALAGGVQAIPATAALSLKTIFTDIATAANAFVPMQAKAARMGLVPR